MSVEVKIPAVGESVNEAIIAQWFKKVGDTVAVDEPIAELETDKVTLELPSPVSGTILELKVEVGDTALVGDVIAMIEEGEVATPSAPAVEDAAAEAPATEAPAAPAPSSAEQGPIMPAAARLLAQHGLQASDVKATGPGGRLLKEDVENHVAGAAAAPPAAAPAPALGSRDVERVKMTSIRKRIAERLVAAQQGAALLTTFNEVDMSAVMEMRKRYKDSFLDRHGVKLGFMSFFVKATIDALRQFPRINAKIEGDEIVYHNYFDIGVAVTTDRGLMVPVLRNAEAMSFAEVENAIIDYGTRARTGKIKLEELEGGTFTISNGGIFGSMLSTPIINPPQSGVLGMHNIVERPVAVNGEVVIRPVMYLALSYDHRIVDGREAVTFLRRIKEAIEDPSRMLLEA
ncbi:MAG: 2-oxoglutarate dehydrogenase complex dihydrolipoyllysine-residue succinyltransferase [Acidobacteriota bacterium]